MNKQEFLAELRRGLSGLPQRDIEERLNFYREMIDDRVEEGLTEEEAISEIGLVDDVTAQIISEIPLPGYADEKPKRAGTWKTVLLVLGSPIWVLLLCAAAILVMAACIVIWAVIISLYAVDLTFAVGGIAGMIGVFVYISSGNIPGAVLFLGAGLVCAGLTILLFFGFNQVTKGVLILSRKMLFQIKSVFVRKGKA